MAENVLRLFKKDDITIDFAGKKEAIIFDMNAVLELEAMYGSIDTVFKMLFSQAPADKPVIKVNGEIVDILSITVDDEPLIQRLQAINAHNAEQTKSGIKDTINLLWVGLLHNHAKRDEDGEIISCDLTRRMFRNELSFKNQLSEINTQIVSALIRDLIAPDSEETQGEAIKN